MVSSAGSSSAAVHQQADHLYAQGQFFSASEVYPKDLSAEIERHGADSDQAVDLMKKLGKCLRKCGGFQLALELYEHWISFLDKKSHVETARTWDHLGICCQRLGNYPRALYAHERALEIKQALRKDRTWISIANTLNHKANCLALTGQFEEAHRTHVTAMHALMHDGFNCTDLEAPLDEYAIHGKSGARKVRHLITLGNYHRSRADYYQALNTYREALAILKERRKDQPHPETAHLLNHIGDCLRNLGSFREARTRHQEAFKIQKQICPQGVIDMAQSLSGISKCVCHFGFEEGAKSTVHGLLQASEQAGQVFVELYLDEANLFLSSGQTQEAMLRYEKALMHLTALAQRYSSSKYPISDLEKGTLKASMGACLRILGKYHQALPHLEEAECLLRSALGNDHPAVASCLDSIGACYHSIGKFEMAYDFHSRALEIKERTFNRKVDLQHVGLRFAFQHPTIADSMEGIGNAVFSLGKIEEAFHIHQRVLNTRTAIFGKIHPSVAASNINIASCLSFLSRHQEALEHYRDAEQIYQETTGPEHPNATFSNCCTRTCRSLLEGRTELLKDEVQLLTREEFQGLIAYASHYLETKKPEELKFFTNPTGFIRLQLPPPEHLAHRVDKVRLNYWPRDFKIDVVEHQHTHPDYFESQILSGGYTHSVFERTQSSSTYKAHRVFKDTLDNRSFFFMGSLHLKHLKDETTEKGTIMRFPRTLIHQVIRTQPGTLSINCVFKSPDFNFYDVFIPMDSATDPRVDREVLMEQEATPIYMQIKDLLQDYSSSSSKKG